MQTKSNAKKIVVLTDIHGYFENFKLLETELSGANLVVICGDLTNFGREPEAKDGIECLKSYNSNIISIAGNCDYASVATFLSNEGMNIAETPFNFHGIEFIGVPGSLETPTKCTPSEHTEEYYKKTLRSIVNGGKQFVLVSHQPPFGTLNDRVGSGMHVGSRELRSFIEKTQPILCLSGHIHEGIGVDQIGKTKIVNPGPMKDGYYALIDLDVTSGSSSVELRKIGINHE